MKISEVVIRIKEFTINITRYILTIACVPAVGEPNSLIQHTRRWDETIQYVGSAMKDGAEVTKVCKQKLNWWRNNHSITYTFKYSALLTLLTLVLIQNFNW